MAHTEGRYQQDLGFSDGYLYVPAPDFVNLPVVGGFTLTRNNPGDFSWNVAAATGPGNLSVNISDGQLSRTGFGEDLQEQFGGTGIPGSAQPQVYRPDVIPAMAAAQQLQPRTGLKVKGFKPLSLKVTYLITGGALTTHTIRVDRITHGNNLANVITAIIASGANGLATAAQANPYVTVVPFSAAQQVYQVTDLSALWVELTVTTPGGVTYRLYSVEMSVEFNFN